MIGVIESVGIGVREMKRLEKYVLVELKSIYVVCSL